MNGLDFERNALDAIGNRALDMQNEFLDKFRQLRHVCKPIDTDVSRDVLLKSTYIALLENVKNEIEKELEALEK